jgi:hypothetical protein
MTDKGRVRLKFHIPVGTNWITLGATSLLGPLAPVVVIETTSGPLREIPEPQDGQGNHYFS